MKTFVFGLLTIQAIVSVTVLGMIFYQKPHQTEVPKTDSQKIYDYSLFVSWNDNKTGGLVVVEPEPRGGCGVGLSDSLGEAIGFAKTTHCSIPFVINHDLWEKVMNHEIGMPSNYFISRPTNLQSLE